MRVSKILMNNNHNIKDNIVCLLNKLEKQLLIKNINNL